MYIHNNNNEDLFRGPQAASELLHDSTERTKKGCNDIFSGRALTVATGCGNILFARIESAVALVIELAFMMHAMGMSLIATPCVIIPTTILDLLTRLPGVSSFEKVQNFTRTCDDLIYRTLRVHFLAIPVITLTVTESFVNIFIPLPPQNYFSRAVHALVDDLGPIVALERNIAGTRIGRDLSLLEIGEDFLRAHAFMPAEATTTLKQMNSMNKALEEEQRTLEIQRAQKEGMDLVLIPDLTYIAFEYI